MNFVFVVIDDDEDDIQMNHHHNLNFVEQMKYLKKVTFLYVHH
jgi:hypothetical protein